MFLRGLGLVDWRAVMIVSWALSVWNGRQLMPLQKRHFLQALILYAPIIVDSAPMLIAYLLVQKYFVRGVMIGAIKA